MRTLEERIDATKGTAPWRPMLCEAWKVMGHPSEGVLVLTAPGLGRLYPVITLVSEEAAASLAMANPTTVIIPLAGLETP